MRTPGAGIVRVSISAIATLVHDKFIGSCDTHLLGIYHSLTLSLELEHRTKKRCCVLCPRSSWWGLVVVAAVVPAPSHSSVLLSWPWLFFPWHGSLGWACAECFPPFETAGLAGKQLWPSECGLSTTCKICSSFYLPPRAECFCLSLTDFPVTGEPSPESIQLLSFFKFYWRVVLFFSFFKQFLALLIVGIFFSCIFISWRLITLQYCSGFCHTLTWISHGFTCVPHPDPPSFLPPHAIPLGLPSAPALSTCLMHPTWAGDLFHPW